MVCEFIKTTPPALPYSVTCNSKHVTVTDFELTIVPKNISKTCNCLICPLKGFYANVNTYLLIQNSNVPRSIKMAEQWQEFQKLQRHLDVAAKS